MKAGIQWMLIAVAALAVVGVNAALRVGVTEDGVFRKGDTVVLIGDSITEQGFRNPWGYYHVLTNAVAKDERLGGLGLDVVPLGFSGYQVKSWSNMERDSVANTNRWTNYRDPGWNLKTVFDGKVDVVVIFLGMNDILQPSIRDNESDLNRWIADYRAFVADIRERCNPRQFVFATITPLTADETSPKNRVRDRLNNRLKRLAEEEGAIIADFGDAVCGAMNLAMGIDASARLVPDFVHPNAVGHSELASCLLEALGEDAAASTAEAASVSYFAEQAVARGNTVSARLEMLRTARPDDEELVYNVIFSVSDGTESAMDAENRLVVPTGWSVDEPVITGSVGSFAVRGKPERSVNPIVVESLLSDGTVARTSVDIPAPWKLREDGGAWKVYTATDEYTGGMKTGSIDPYQCFFGWKSNTLVAARRVWSEKDRDVKAALSHQGFSETLDLTVALDGKPVWKDNLDRDGRNRIEKTLRLHEGWNAVEITCVHRDWQRQFAFDLEPLDGDDLSGLKYDLK